mgnify:CR=1 FL=1
MNGLEAAKAIRALPVKDAQTVPYRRDDGQRFS